MKDWKEAKPGDDWSLANFGIDALDISELEACETTYPGRNLYLFWLLGMKRNWVAISMYPYGFSNEWTRSTVSDEIHYYYMCKKYGLKDGWKGEQND